MNSESTKLIPAADFHDDNTWSLISSLDFELLKRKLTFSGTGGLAWDRADADVAEQWYKRYLFLAAKYPNALLVPNTVIDEVWHQHILDTRMYERDCQKIFGKPFHHYPYAGMLGSVDFERWTNNIEVTKLIFKREFGVEYAQAAEESSMCKCCDVTEFTTGYFGSASDNPEYANYVSRVS